MLNNENIFQEKRKDCKSKGDLLAPSFKKK